MEKFGYDKVVDEEQQLPLENGKQPRLVCGLSVLVSICTTLLAFALMLSIAQMIYIHRIEDHENRMNALKMCKVINYNSLNYINMYPKDSLKRFVINFNASWNEANYVYYISNIDGSACHDAKCSAYVNDPYDLIKIKNAACMHADKKYECAGLVPNADYGADTLIASNIVAMLRQFKHGAWSQSERYIRSKYVGKLVFKGCEYDDDNVYRIPIGCFYVVFDTSTLPDPHSVFNKISVLDYGYYANSENSIKQDKLPYWIECN